ncbi:MAG: hypothetical protein QW493_05775, partial [Candidatus Bathyarchaeia archaeon]
MFCSYFWAKFLRFKIHFILSRLQSLKEKEIQTVREAFIKHSHARFMKYFFCHMPFGKKQTYIKEVEEASLERLA